MGCGVHSAIRLAEEEVMLWHRCILKHAEENIEVRKPRWTGGERPRASYPVIRSGLIAGDWSLEVYCKSVRTIVYPVISRSTSRCSKGRGTPSLSQHISTSGFEAHQLNVFKLSRSPSSCPMSVPLGERWAFRVVYSVLSDWRFFFFAASETSAGRLPSAFAESE